MVKCDKCENELSEKAKLPTCEPCRRNAKAKEKRKENPRCKKVKKNNKNCTYEVLLHGYCGKHKIEIWVDIVRAGGKEPCSGYLRGCRVELDPDGPKKCPHCRKKENDADKRRRGIIKEHNENIGDDEDKICNNCRGTFSKEHFYNKRGQKLSKCPSCLFFQAIYEETRPTTRNERYNIKDKVTEIKNRAKKSNIELLLTDDDIKKIIVLNCTYCNLPADPNANIKYFNGIDRIINSYDYVPGNVCPACDMCNFMKYTHSVDDFIKYCNNINQNKYCLEISNDDMKHSPFSTIKYEAKIRNIEFKLSKDEFNEIIKHKCYYCGNNNIEKQIGIDRICSKIIDDDGNEKKESYNKDNCRACCKICNVMKKNYPIDDFLDHIKKILDYNNSIDKKNKYMIKKFNLNDIKQFDFDETEKKYKKLINIFENKDSKKETFIKEIINNESNNKKKKINIDDNENENENIDFDVSDDINKKIMGKKKINIVDDGNNNLDDYGDVIVNK
ncbi:MAG: hypothetical protein Edafosvirus20_8 [Edafosvirus sp.]|uniref:Uncharacterized protein n=1 Tax=Edafosvirus sp. TaxID=2487765 RepID=A0A3G4ZUN3_9VIRU|nr:MAG: hypothetical protein Edafosvirus20_8 [Edafosvirus sp.]